MTYNYYIKLIRDAAEIDSEEQFIGEVGYPADLELDPDVFIQAMHIIYTAANGDFKELLNGYNIAYFSRAYAIPYRTLQDWRSGVRTAPAYVKHLIAYAIISDLSQFSEDYLNSIKKI